MTGHSDSLTLFPFIRVNGYVCVCVRTAYKGE